MDTVRIYIHVSPAKLCDGVLDTGQLEQYISLYRYLDGVGHASWGAHGQANL